MIGIKKNLKICALHEKKLQIILSMTIVKYFYVTGEHAHLQH